MYDRLFDMICVVDPTGVLLYANKAFHTFAQTSKTSVGKESIYQILELSLMQGEGHPLVQSIQKEKYLGLREMEGRLKDGSHFSIMLGLQPLYDDAEEDIDCVLMSIQDKSLEFNLHVKYRDMIDKIESEFNESVRVFSNITDMVELGGQSLGVRVSTLAKRIAEQMGMDEKESRKVEVAGRLHRIGMMGMPPGILEKKESELSPLERKEYEKYPVLGSLVFDGIEAFGDICRYIHEHREQYDGKGFPRGLREEGISLGGFIVGLALDAVLLESNSRSVDDIFKGINQQRQILYHPDVVDAYAEVVSTQSNFIQKMERKTIELSALRPGMTLAKNLRSGKGILLLQAEEKVTGSALKRLHSFHENDPIEDTVDIYAPVAAEELVMRKAQAKEKKNRRILVVDDTVDLNMLLCMMINKAEGMTAEGVYSGPEALQILEEQKFDAMLLDVMMPIMSGIQTLEEVRKLYPNLPVVMCTAKSEEGDVLDAFRLGADDYLVKPIKKEPLREALQQILDKYSATHLDYKQLRREQMTQVLKKVAPELLLKKDEQKLSLSVRYRVLKGGIPSGDTLKSDAKDLSRVGFTILAKTDLAVGMRVTFALENIVEKRLLLAGVAVVKGTGLERGQRTYKVDFISVRKPS